MKYLKIKQNLEELRVFSLNDLYLVDPNFRQATLYDWEDQGKVKKIRNKWYVFNDFEPKDLDYYLIANRIYSPSYISLELALNHHGVIPEAVQQITSVTTLKTNTFDTDYGRFSYKSVKEGLFWGYEIVESDKIGVQVAYLEKAILDTLYLNPHISSVEDFEALRYNKFVLNQNLDIDKLKKFLIIFDNKRLKKTTNTLLKYLSGTNA